MMNDCYLDFSGGGGGVFILWNVLSSLNLIFSIPLTIYVTILWFLVPLSHCCCCCLTCTQRFPNCIELGNQFKETNYVVPKSIASPPFHSQNVIQMVSFLFLSPSPSPLWPRIITCRRDRSIYWSLFVEINWQIRSALGLIPPIPLPFVSCCCLPSVVVVLELIG